MKAIEAHVHEIIRESAETCREAAQAMMHVELAYDEPSIFRIDELIESGWPRGQPPPGTLQVWGAFLGEAMCAQLQASWVETESGFGVAVGDAVAHPFAKVEKRFVAGPVESITHFYNGFKRLLQGSR